MKKLFIFLLMILAFANVYSQSVLPLEADTVKVKKRISGDAVLDVKGTIQVSNVPAGATYMPVFVYDSVTHQFKRIPQSSIAPDSTKFVTYTAGDNRYVKIQTQNPTATLSGGYSYERHASGTFSVSLSWSAGRQAAGTGVNATNPLSSIVVAGTSQTFSQPSSGSSVSGSQSTGTMSYNTNYTFYNTVTTTDSKTAVASTSFGAYDKRYLGWSATTTPTSAEILAAVYQDNSGNNSSLTNTLAQLGSDKHLFFVTTSTVSSVSVNGFPSTAAFSLNNSISFTNASGGTFTGYYTVSNNAFGSTSTNTVIFN